MGDVIQFQRPARALPSGTRPKVDPLCHKWRAFCGMSNDLARRRGEPYELIAALKERWTDILARGDGKRELCKLRKLIGR